jgi:putative spermidine/putrescine transport system ATP-binding protein
VTVATQAEAHLQVAGIGKQFGGQTVIQALDFAVQRGELVSLLGPSGCGKTTLLRMIAGLVQADAGRITLGGRELAQVPAHKRNISVVFQSYALFPHLSVRENVAFGLRARGSTAAAAQPAVEEALALVRMTALAERSITQLSGGQQQRVAVARALVVNPDLLLLDEPFSALDRKLRETMQIELKALLRSRGMTAVFVTHDQDEALTVSDRIAVMNAGRIEHFADPGTLYDRPATAFALEFVGLSTRLSGVVREVHGEDILIDTAIGAVTARAAFRPGAPVLVGVRPERIRLGPPGDAAAPDHNQGVATLRDIVPLGARTHVYAQVPDGDRLLCEVPGGTGSLALTEGSAAAFTWPVADTLVYPGAA